MGNIERFEDLDIWKQARVFASEIYLLTEKETFSKEYRLKDQMKASSGSVMDNVAEGFERGGNKEFIQFLFIAKGSAGETRSQLYRALDVKLIDEEEFNESLKKAMKISQSLSNFIKYLKQSDYKGAKYK